MGELLAVLSGKGGTGKTSVCAGLATALAREGKQVLCIDCDVGLRNLDISLGMSDIGALSFLDVSEWKELLSGLQVEKWDSSALVDEFYLLAYAKENFASYVRSPARESALQYETEYLIAGKASDRENLKAVANRILGLRFLANYVYLSGSSEWKAASANAAHAVT